MEAESSRQRGGKPTPHGNETATRRRLMTAALLFSLVFLVAFVPFPLDLIEKVKKNAPTGPARFSATLAGRPCTIEINAPASHKIIFAGEEPLADPGPGKGGGYQALWRLFDFYSKAKVPDYLKLLGDCGIDVEKRGLVRVDPLGDATAVVLGSVGETEPDSPHAAFERAQWRVWRMVMADGSRAEVPEYTDKGWPKRISGTFGEIVISGPAEAAKSQRKQ